MTHFQVLRRNDHVCLSPLTLHSMKQSLYNKGLEEGDLRMKQSGFATFMRYFYPFLLFVGIMVAVSRSLDEPAPDNSTERSFTISPIQ